MASGMWEEIKLSVGKRASSERELSEAYTHTLDIPYGMARPQAGSISPAWIPEWETCKTDLPKTFDLILAWSNQVPVGLFFWVNVSYDKSLRFWGCLLHSIVDIYFSTFQWRFHVCMHATCMYICKKHIHIYIHNNDIFFPDHCFLVFLSMCI